MKATNNDTVTTPIVSKTAFRITVLFTLPGGAILMELRTSPDILSILSIVIVKRDNWEPTVLMIPRAAQPGPVNQVICWAQKSYPKMKLS